MRFLELVQVRDLFGVGVIKLYVEKRSSFVQPERVEISFAGCIVSYYGEFSEGVEIRRLWTKKQIPARGFVEKVGNLGVNVWFTCESVEYRVESV